MNRVKLINWFYSVVSLYYSVSVFIGLIVPLFPGGQDHPRSLDRQNTEPSSRCERKLRQADRTRSLLVEPAGYVTRASTDDITTARFYVDTRAPVVLTFDLNVRG